MIRLVILVSEHAQEPRAHSIQLADISCREWSLIDNENCEACPLTRAVMNYNCTVVCNLSFRAMSGHSHSPVVVSQDTLWPLSSWLWEWRRQSADRTARL